MVHRLYCLGATGFIVTVLRLLRIGTVGAYQERAKKSRHKDGFPLE